MPNSPAAINTSTSVKTGALMPAFFVCTAGLAAKDATGPHRERDQEKAEGHRGRPGRTEEGRGQALDDAQRDGRDHHTGEAAEAAQHADREDAADIFAADRGLDRLDNDQDGAAQRRGGDRNAEGDAL